MKIFWIASLVLLTSLASAKPVPQAEMVCGIHTAQGKLLLNKQGQFILAAGNINVGYRELLILGGGARNKLSRVRSRVHAKVYAPANYSAGTPPSVFLVEMGPAKGREDEIKLVERQPCGQAKYFRSGRK